MAVTGVLDFFFFSFWNLALPRLEIWRRLIFQTARLLQIFIFVSQLKVNSAKYYFIGRLFKSLNCTGKARRSFVPRSLLLNPTQIILRIKDSTIKWQLSLRNTWKFSARDHQLSQFSQVWISLSFSRLQMLLPRPSCLAKFAFKEVSKRPIGPWFPLTLPCYPPWYNIARWLQFPGRG